MKLTPKQVTDLHRAYCERAGVSGGLQAVCDAHLAMIAASPTHRVVEAPYGYEWDRSIGTLTETGDIPRPQMTLPLRRTPKPCPPPVLEPVTVTVESVYECKPEVPEGFRAVFGLASQLRDQGFTHYIGNLGGRVADIEGLDEYAYRICLRKWEGK
jgi:hypothetical protein